MKKLFLLRHAQTFPAEGATDSERRLTPDGQADARALGAVMKQNGYVPDLVLCSPARRTQETLRGVMETLQAGCPVETTATIYNGAREDIFHLVQSATPKAQNLLIVGHNPTIHALAGTLAREQSAVLMNKIAGSYPPGTLSVLDCPCESWAEIQPGKNRLIDVLEALDYNAPTTPARRT